MNWKSLLFWKKKHTHREGRTHRPESEEIRRLQTRLNELDKQLELLDVLCAGGHTTQSWQRCRKELRREFHETLVQLKQARKECSE